MPTETLIRADIFFFISSIGFILLTIALLTGLFYVIRIMKSVDRITAKIESGIDTAGDEAKEFIADLRDSTAFRMVFGSKRSKKTSTRK